MKTLIYSRNIELESFEKAEKKGFYFCEDKTLPKEAELSEKITIKAVIDCPHCAMKIEKGLNDHDDIYKAVFDFNNSLLHVEGAIIESEIKERCLKIDDDISFPSSLKKFTFDVSIDCPNCAKKVENFLNESPYVESAFFDFNSSKLAIETSLSEEEVKALAKSADDELEFIDKTKKSTEEKDNAPIRIITSLILLALAMLFNFPLIAIISYFIAGYDVIYKAIKNILKGDIFNENFLMTIATIGALLIASFDEACGVMVFYQVGEYFQRKAVGKSRASISQLLDLTPDYVSVIRDGKERLVKAEDVQIGEIMILKPGERLALDGVVVEGTSYLDTKALTGESLPRKASEGDSILSGSVNGEGLLKVRAASLYQDSTASKIVKLAKESEGRKAKSEMFITRFSRYYTPLVTISAILLALLPPLFGLWDLKSSLYRACMLLVISCPCALVLSVPLTYFASIGAFAKNGILVKGAGTIEVLTKVKTLAIDKTGTLTEGKFQVRRFTLLDFSYTEEEAKAISYALESSSSHPIAKAIAQYCMGGYEAKDIVEKSGIGIAGTVNGSLYSIGNRRVLKSDEIEDNDASVFLAKEGIAIASFTVSDSIKESSIEAVKEIRRAGVDNIVMLSGDRKESADAVAAELELDGAYSELLPHQKLEILETLIEKNRTAYAGDGINDSPSLRRADAGIAMGSAGSDAAIESADAVILNDDIGKIAKAIMIAKRTESIVKENIYLSIGVKAIVFVLAILGASNMWLAVLADTGVAAVAVINAMRAFDYRR